jgi:uncharacterized protein YkwD
MLSIAILVNLAIVGAIIYAAFTGTKRGMVLIGLELLSFAVATGLAFSIYRPLGTFLKSSMHVTASLGNIAAFVLVWVFAEVTCALAIRFAVLPRLHRGIQLSRVNKAGGAVLNAFKTTAIIALALMIFAGLPLSPATKQPVTNSFMARHLLAASGPLPARFAAGIGHDLNDSLNFFTITSEPESEQRIDLSFTTTDVQVDEEAEAAMLVLINRERLQHSLSPLTLNSKARDVARAYSKDMFARGYFSHVNPEGKNPFDRMKAGGVQYNAAGENLALAPTLTLAHEGLMKSPGHRANILSTNYKRVGIGIVDSAPHGLMITQNFTD